MTADELKRLTNWELLLLLRMVQQEAKRRNEAIPGSVCPESTRIKS